MKRLFMFVSIALLAGLILGAAPIIASADASGSCGENITYEYVSETKTVTLTGTGAMTDYASAAKSPFYNFRNELTTVVIGEGITTVGTYAFANQNKLTTISLPSTMTALKKAAFNQCRAVTSCNFPDSITTIASNACNYWTAFPGAALPASLTTIESNSFGNWQSAAELNIPGGVKYIPINAFSGWTSLTSLTLNEGLEEIAGQAFGSVKITEVTLPASLTAIGVRAFDGANDLAAYYVAEGSSSFMAEDGVLYTAGGQTLVACPPAKAGTVNVHNGCEVIGPSAFYDCYSVTGIEIPDTVTTLASAALERCGITSITIPASVTSMEASPFSNCESLTTVVMNASVSTLPQNCFYYCTALTDVTINSNITSLEPGVFNSCSSLVSVELPEGLTEIPENTFYYCSALTSVEIPETVTVIGASAFYGCTSLTALELPEGVTAIGSSAFNGCSFTELVLPEGLTSLGSSAFSQCKQLTSMVLPENIIEIPGMLFAGCSALQTVEVMGDINLASYTAINSGAFNNTTSLERIIFHCACPDASKINKYAFNNTASGVEVHYPAQYAEWAENKPLDVNGNKFIYVADYTAPKVEIMRAELRTRPNADSYRDIRFIAVLTPAFGSEVTARYAVFTLPNGSTHTLNCPLNFAEPDNGTTLFTAVIKTVPPRYFDSEFTCRFFIEYAGELNGTASSEPLTVTVNGLTEED